MALLAGLLLALPFYFALRYVIVKREDAHAVPHSVQGYGSASDSVGFMSAIMVNLLSSLGQILYVALGGASFASSFSPLSTSPALSGGILVGLGAGFVYFIWYCVDRHKKSVKLMMEDL